MNRGFLGQSALYAVATVAPILVNLAVTPFVTRILGSESYGIVAVSITLFQFGVVVFTLGLASAITRQAIMEATGAAGAVATVLLGAVSAVLIFGVAVISLPAWGWMLLPPEDIGVLISPLASCLGLAFLQNAQSLYRAEQRVVSFVVLSATASILAPIVGMLLLHFVERSPNLYLAGLSATHLSVGMVAIFRCLGISRPRFVRGDFRSCLRIGLPTVPHQVATSLLVLVSVSLASQSVGLAGAGALQIGLLIGSAPSLLLGASNNAWAPLIYRTASDQRGVVLAATFQGFMMLTTLLVVGFSVVAYPVVSLVAGPIAHGMPVAQVALIAATSAPFMTLYLANIHLVFLSGRTSALAITTPISACAAVGIVILIGRLAPEIDIRILALAIPLFQLFQWLVSIRLRRARSDISLPFLVAGPELFVIFAALGLGFFASSNLLIVVLGSLTLVLCLSFHRLDLIRGYFVPRRTRIDAS